MKTKIVALVLAAAGIGGCGTTDPEAFDERLQRACGILEIECLQVEALFNTMSKSGQTATMNDSRTMDGTETFRELTALGRQRLVKELAALRPPPVGKERVVDLADELFANLGVAADALDFPGQADAKRKMAAELAIKKMLAVKTALSLAAPPATSCLSIP